MVDKLPIYLGALILLIIANISYAYFPKLIGQFTNQLEQGHLSAATIRKFSLTLIAIAFAYGGFFGCGQLLNHRMGRSFEYRMRGRLFRHLTELGESFYARNGVGKLLSYFMNDMNMIRESIANGLNQMTNALSLLVSVMIMMATSGIPLTLMLVCVAPLLAIPFLVVHFGPQIRMRSTKVQEALAAMTESAEEQFTGIKVTKTFAAEPTAWQRFGRRVERIKSRQLQLVKTSSLFQALLPFVGGLSLVISLIYGGYLAANGSITLGSFVELTLYMKMIVTPLQQLGNVFNIMQRSRGSLDRVDELLAVQPEIADAPDALELAPQACELELRGLTFRYPDAAQPALQDVSFRLTPGQTLGIVGRTGSGKSTLVKLLLRVYNPPEGSIYMGGEDIRRIKLQSLRTHMAYVPQEGFLFSTTIADNIAFYNRKAPMEQIEQAARQADIYEPIAAFDKGFATRLGERGLTLSGGQRQRTSIARGFLKEAPLLIMDDSVSAVDTITETRILTNLRRLRKDKTTLIVAHRISAVQHADLILVLDKGTVIERGTHAELLAAGGEYASLYAIQQGGEPDGPCE